MHILDSLDPPLVAPPANPASVSLPLPPLQEAPITPPQALENTKPQDPKPIELHWK
jgi:hypothetical protein